MVETPMPSSPEAYRGTRSGHRELDSWERGVGGWLRQGGGCGWVGAVQPCTWKEGRKGV